MDNTLSQALWDLTWFNKLASFACLHKSVKYLINLKYILISALYLKETISHKSSNHDIFNSFNMTASPITINKSFTDCLYIMHCLYHYNSVILVTTLPILHRLLFLAEGEYLCWYNSSSSLSIQSPLPLFLLSLCLLLLHRMHRELRDHKTHTNQTFHIISPVN